MSKSEQQKNQEIKNLEERGYKRYPKSFKNYPVESGKMICLFQASTEAPWAQTKISKEHWEYYKKTSDIKDRSFYWKATN